MFFTIIIWWHAIWETTTLRWASPALKAFSDLNWKSEQVHAGDQSGDDSIHVPIFISIYPFFLCDTHTEQSTPCSYLPQILIYQILAEWHFCDHHLVAADSPRGDNTRWRVDGIINNDCHPFQLSGRAASHNGPRRQEKHKHMLLTHRDSDL